MYASLPDRIRSQATELTSSSEETRPTREDNVYSARIGIGNSVATLMRSPATNQLKLQPNRQPNPPCAIRPIGRRIRPERIRISDIKIRLARISEVRMIQQIQQIGGELRIQALRDFRVPANAKIDVLKANP